MSVLAVRYKQRGHIADNLVEHHRQSALGKAKGGAAIGSLPPRNDKTEKITETAHDFK